MPIFCQIILTYLKFFLKSDFFNPTELFPSLSFVTLMKKFKILKVEDDAAVLCPWCNPYWVIPCGVGLG